MQREGTEAGRGCRGVADSAGACGCRVADRGAVSAGCSFRIGDHAEPAGLAQPFRRGARDCGLHRPSAGGSGDSRTSHRACRPGGQDRSQRMLLLHPAADPRGKGRSEPAMAGRSSRRSRPAPGQQRGRCHELRALRTRPAAARIRCSKNRRPASRPPRGRRRRLPRARRADLQAGRRFSRDRRRQTACRAGRGDGRRGLRRLGSHDRHPARERGIRSRLCAPGLADARPDQRFQLPVRAWRRSRDGRLRLCTRRGADRPGRRRSCR